MAFTLVGMRRSRGTPAGEGIPDPPAGGTFLTNRNVALMGDSLTERAFGSTPFYWQNGLLGAPMKVVANSGLSGRSILDVRNQLNNSYKLLTGAGFGGLPPLGISFLRIGTNTVRGAAGSTGIPISSGNQADYVTILNTMKTYSEHVVVFPVPPIGGFAIARNTAVAGYNTYLQGLCAADPRLHWIDDCYGLVDGSGNVLPQYFDSDELHMNAAGTLKMGQDSVGALTTLMANLYGPGWRINRLVRDPADIYPNTNQWVPNPTNQGGPYTLLAGWTGTAPSGWTIQSNGAGMAGVVGIAPADIGDPNPVPWFRVTPSQCQVGSNISISFNGSGRTITAAPGGVPDPLEQMLEIRGNNLVNFRDITYWLQAGGLRITPNARLRWGTTGMNATATLQQEHHRIDGGGGSPLIVVYIGAGVTASGSMGSIDLRCLSMRG